MGDSFRRALRTFLQAFLGVLISSGILSAMGEDSVVDWAGVKKVALSAVGAGIVALVAWLQNFLEDTGKIPEIIQK